MSYATGNTWGLVVLAAVSALSLSRPSWPTFDDVTAARGVSFRHRGCPRTESYQLEPMGSRVAIFDANVDGLVDLFFVNGAKVDAPIQAGAVPRKTAPDYWNRLFVKREGQP